MHRLHEFKDILLIWLGEMKYFFYSIIDNKLVMM